MVTKGAEQVNALLEQLPVSIRNSLKHAHPAIKSLVRDVSTDEKKISKLLELNEKLSGIPEKGIYLTKSQAKELTEIKTIDQLRTGLQIATELELTVMLEYLYAAFSLGEYPCEIRNTLNENGIALKFGSYLMEVVREYRYQLYFIAEQEMVHLAMACNLLVSVGGVPNLQLVSFPGEYGERKIKSQTLRFGLKSLVEFLNNEQPYKLTEKKLISPADKETYDESSDDFAYVTISQLYTALRNGFNYFESKGEWIFTEVQGYQQTSHSHAILVTDYASAFKAIYTITVEGEGSSTTNEFTVTIELFRETLKKVEPTDKKLHLIWVEMDIVSKNIYDESIGIGNNMNVLLVDIFELDTLFKNWILKGGPAFFPPTLKPDPKKDPSILPIFDLPPSHWDRFLSMAFNYVLVEMQLTESQDEIFLSRPVLENPQIKANEFQPESDKKLNFITDPIVEPLARVCALGYHILLKFVDALYLVAPESSDYKDMVPNLPQRLGYFFKFMTTIFQPLGEVITYFAATPDNKSAAGIPFIRLKVDKPICNLPKKFFDIVKDVNQMFNELNTLCTNTDWIQKARKRIVPWIKNEDVKLDIEKKIIQRLIYTNKTLKFLASGLANGIPEVIMAIENLPAPPLGPETEIPGPEIPEIPLNSQEHGLKPVLDKFYINVEFEGFFIYPQATDPDCSDDPIGIIGTMNAFYDDPMLDQRVYTRNAPFIQSYNQRVSPTGSDGYWSQRSCVPDNRYKGVHVNKVSGILPEYLISSDGKIPDEFKTESEQIRKKIEDMFQGSYLDMLPFEQDNQWFYPMIPQRNGLLTGQVPVSPVNIMIQSKDKDNKDKNYSIRRVNLLSKTTEEKNTILYPNLTLDLACFSEGAPFLTPTTFPTLITPRVPISGNFQAWSEWGLNTNSGGVSASNTNNINVKFGQTLNDYRKTLRARYNCLESRFIDIVNKYGGKDPLIPGLLKLLKFSSFSLITYLIVAEIKNSTAQAELAILSKRMRQLARLYQPNRYPLNAPEYRYLIPLNGHSGEKYLDVNLPSPLDQSIIKDEPWSMEFTLGGADFDALAFYMKGSLMLPFKLNPKKLTAHD